MKKEVPEYRCNRCNTDFDTPKLMAVGAKVNCPNCGNDLVLRLTKKIREAEKRFPLTKKEWEEECGFYERESYLVRAIRQHLLTDEQSKTLFWAMLSIEDILNGRYNEEQEKKVHGIYAEWNDKLGWTEFGEK